MHRCLRSDADRPFHSGRRDRHTWYRPKPRQWGSAATCCEFDAEPSRGSKAFGRIRTLMSGRFASREGKTEAMVRPRRVHHTFDGVNPVESHRAAVSDCSRNAGQALQAGRSPTSAGTVLQHPAVVCHVSRPAAPACGFHSPSRSSTPTRSALRSDRLVRPRSGRTQACRGAPRSSQQSTTCPAKCSSTHPIRKRPGWWC